MVTVNLKKWGGGLPKLGLAKCCWRRALSESFYPIAGSTTQEQEKINMCIGMSC